MNSTPSLTPERVAEWLRDHPDLLRHYPDLIERLELPDDGPAVSLVHRQAARLRQRNAQLEDQLNHLTGIAGENERLMQRLHQLTLDVMTTQSSAAFIERLFDRLAADFNAEDVRLHLLEPSKELVEVARVAVRGEDRPEWFDKLLERGVAHCGRLTRAKTDLLFPNRTAEIGSSALVPIAGTGLLAIGSSREDRFHPGVGTLFLELIGTTIGYRLKKVESIDRKRA
ncbi:MAG: DUF484 family protein [Wenzhouxiangella sp.]|nr:MAG: DUF484 family protein [Wenzhouxiangella sp.]